MAEILILQLVTWASSRIDWLMSLEWRWSQTETGCPKSRGWSYEVRTKEEKETKQCLWLCLGIAHQKTSWVASLLSTRISESNHRASEFGSPSPSSNVKSVGSARVAWCLRRDLQQSTICNTQQQDCSNKDHFASVSSGRRVMATAKIAKRRSMWNRAKPVLAYNKQMYHVSRL